MLHFVQLSCFANPGTFYIEVDLRALPPLIRQIDKQDFRRFRKLYPKLQTIF